ncbi:GDSL esterase/lipase At1g29660-like [Vicia villosa]|uniref:GDSL esterase/lipase At1g29660-like n=1 Tax=Vicia villosa TaxID=3911 RepID=UPI00273C6BE3|nr:GDSL esterase/lipase At1g29660-like [Vicia villosa]
MAGETKTLFGLYLVLLAACYMQHCVNGESQVPCLFIFGDSFSDSGNNNYIETTANSDYLPFGIDFPTGPTGRATNGRTKIDIIGELLGFEKKIPPFANTTGYDILKGVNYASSSGGILYETGKKTAINNIYLGLQLQNHKITVSRIVAELGGLAQAKDHLSKCLYYVYMGTNDYALNYFQPQHYSTSKQYNPTEYAQLLIDQLSNYLQVLHNNYARKLVLVGLDKIGCSPLAISDEGKPIGSCVEEQNDAALIYSQKLRSLVEDFNSLVLYSKTIFINTTALVPDSSVGFTVTDRACCPLKANGFCFPDSIPCTNRNEYVWFDGIHPTEAVNNFVALAAYNSADTPDVTYPLDISQLAQYVTGKGT